MSYFAFGNNKIRRYSVFSFYPARLCNKIVLKKTLLITQVEAARFHQISKHKVDVIPEFNQGIKLGGF